MAPVWNAALQRSRGTSPSGSSRSRDASPGRPARDRAFAPPTLQSRRPASAEHGHAFVAAVPVRPDPLRRSATRDRLRVACSEGRPALEGRGWRATSRSRHPGDALHRCRHSAHALDDADAGARRRRRHRSRRGSSTRAARECWPPRQPSRASRFTCCATRDKFVMPMLLPAALDPRRHRPPKCGTAPPAGVDRAQPVFRVDSARPRHERHQRHSASSAAAWSLGRVRAAHGRGTCC